MADLNIRPLADRVIIEPAAAETKTASGIIIPDTAQEKPQKGIVVAVETRFIPITNTNKPITKAQVALSKKSVVFLTPPNICGLSPPKAELKPPPLGF